MFVSLWAPTVSTTFKNGNNLIYIQYILQKSKNATKAKEITDIKQFLRP